MKQWFKNWMGGRSAHPESAPYYGVWNTFRDLRQARRFIYNAEDEATFDEGGRLDADLIRSYLSPGMDVLDVGCGIGRVEAFLAPDCGTLTGIDISEQMIREGRRRLADHANVTLTRNNGKDLSLFPDDSFDFIFSFFVLQHVEKEDAFRYLREIARVLRPDGSAILQFPLLASGYFQDSFLSDVAAGAPYSVARPRLYTIPEACFFLVRAGLNPLALIHRGDEAIFTLDRSGPDRDVIRQILPWSDPTPMHLYGHCLPTPSEATDVLMGLEEFRAAAENAASGIDGASVVVEGDGGLALSSEGELVVPFGNSTWRDVILDAVFEILEPRDEGGSPDLSIGIRSTVSPNGISGPYVQTDSGNPFVVRIRDGESWDGLPTSDFAPLPPSSGTMNLSLVADGPVLALYGAGAIANTATISPAPGQMYIRVVATSVRIKHLRVGRL